MKIVAIIQARVNSSRLPRKVLLPLAGRPLLWRMLERVQRSTLINQIVVTTPVNDVMEIAKAIPKDIAIDPWVGDENDVVGRHLSAAQWAHADIVVRIPSDNPCVDPAYLDGAVETWRTDCAPFVTNTTALCDGLWVDGIGAEVFSYNRLQWLDRKTAGHAVWREHPHRYFEHCNVLASPRAEIRLDVNTQGDYDYIHAIYEHCYPRNPQFTIHDILTYLQEAGYATQERVQSESH